MSRRHDVALGALFASAGKLGVRAGLTAPAGEWTKAAGGGAARDEPPAAPVAVVPGRRRRSGGGGRADVAEPCARRVPARGVERARGGGGTVAGRRGAGRGGRGGGAVADRARGHARAGAP